MDNNSNPINIELISFSEQNFEKRLIKEIDEI